MLKVLKSGFYTSIQDAGRFGFREYGVPVSGAMDSYSSQFANSLLGNDAKAALLEITLIGPTLQFLQPTIIAISGAEMSPRLNDIPIAMHKAVVVQANTILSFGKLQTGVRAYLSIKGGILSETILNSHSTYSGITSSTQIEKGDILHYEAYSGLLEPTNAHVRYESSILENSVLQVHKGPEFEKLTSNQQELLFKTDFRVSKLNNRMAYQLEPNFEHQLETILTAPVLPGTVQLTPSGRLIVLMRDCQTTGGYPRVLQLSESAINRLAQKKVNEVIQFKNIKVQ